MKPHLKKSFGVTWGIAVWVFVSFLFLGIAPAKAHELLTLGSTHTTEQSGLLDKLLPAFSKDTGIAVRPVIMGTGQVLDAARRGDLDVVLTHDLEAETKLVADGFGRQRWDVMYNDFILVGPLDDPAKAAGRDIVKALLTLAHSTSTFYSRGDKSGTHMAELRYWQMGSITDKSQRGNYKECGCGVGQALNFAAAKQAYVLVDRGSWLNFKNRASLKIVVEGDTRLRNQYGVIAVHPAKHPHVKTKEASAFVDWITSQRGQAVIAAYKINGESAFIPNAASAPAASNAAHPFAPSPSTTSPIFHPKSK